MRAWVVDRYGGPTVLRLRELPDPEPGRGEVLVRVRAIGLNFADCAARLGAYPNVPAPPMVPGMEVAGEVAALGDGVGGLDPGTKVAAVPIFGGHAELVAVPASHVRVLPAAMDFQQGAAIAVTTLTADHALHTVARLRPGERVLINAAAGGVGSMAVQLAVRRGAQVVAVASTEAKRALAAELGAAETYSYENYAEACSGGLDVVLDSVGGRIFRPAWKALNPDGRYVLFGFAAAVGPRRVRYAKAAVELVRMGLVMPSALVSPCRTLAGFNLSLVPHLARELQQRFAAVEAMVASGELRVVVGASFDFEHLPDAHAHLQGRGSIGKVVVTVD